MGALPYRHFDVRSPFILGERGPLVTASASWALVDSGEISLKFVFLVEFFPFFNLSLYLSLFMFRTSGCGGVGFLIPFLIFANQFFALAKVYFD